MEHYRRLGFADEVRAAGLPRDYPTDVAYFTTFCGHELARFEMPSAQDAVARVKSLYHIWNGPEMPHRVPQSVVESIIFKHAQKNESVAIEFNSRVVGYEQNDEGVTDHVEAVGSGELREVRARYLFAADGPQSTVRKAMGVRYEGGDAGARDFMGGQMLSVYLDSPEFYKFCKTQKAWMYWSFSCRRRALLAAVDGKGKFVLQTQLRPGENIESITESVAGDLFLQAVGAEIPFRITGFATWLAGRALVAERFAEGRVLMAGDAVHLFTPTGGMGYNTAIEDAVNAGWKLAAVLKGQASPQLLLSYEAERKPCAHRNTRFAIGFADSVGLYRPTPAIEEEGIAGDAARKRAGAYLARHASNEFHIPGFSLGARYNTSPVIWHDDTLPPPDMPSVYVPTGKPGGRAPHVWLENETSLYDEFGFNWTLLNMSGDRAKASAFVMDAERRGVSLKILELNDPVALDLYETPLALIRPDQIVAWRGEAPDANGAEQIFDSVLGFAAG
nr:FAD-dependent monooxygenase [Martelella sp. NC18]